MVPALDRQELAGRQPLLSDGVPPDFAEAFRAIRTNVLFSSAEEGSRVARHHQHRTRRGQDVGGSNLAIGFAQAGQRVLLIDADMRRPRVHDVFGCEQEPGLSNVLVGNAKTSESDPQDAGARAVGAARRPHSAESRRSCSARSASRTS